jgi:hypothetical protein
MMLWLSSDGEMNASMLMARPAGAQVRPALSSFTPLQVNFAKERLGHGGRKDRTTRSPARSHPLKS